ncbi:SprT-like domain-containing protein [Caldovatus aquaticus]|uniref:SprT-like domain-containing protein n=1 Tax=Caldovatus aquaticus TaxID=2865671 RepID=A0ABS7F482_9PROT|nr:SprT-like domain-containing protein [Caldovatus aquaticus]MBW8270425.1 SprT-like domain-containing protein [Caldovatus aquaticus]
MSRGDAAARRLYAWEDAVVAPRDRSLVPFARLQALVDHVWAGEGLRWPPRVRPLPRRARATLARATRLAIEAPPALPSWVLLHELAHAMTSTAEGEGGGHGPDFVGLYLRLLVRYARLPEPLLAATLAERGIAWTRDARPAFLA